jgi:2'-5' RNA ligase
VTQSVELLLDAATESVVRAEWDRLADAGLPTERRTEPSASHRPHVTLWAGPAVVPEVEETLPGLVDDLPLPVQVGALLLFGPRRGQLVLVRHVVASPVLLALQGRVAEACGVEPDSHFAPGRWTPHVTLARRVQVEQLDAVVAALGEVPDLAATAVRCRRWDGDAKVDWDVGPSNV